jgi:molecular chaperone GrpE
MRKKPHPDAALKAAEPAQPAASAPEVGAAEAPEAGQSESPTASDGGLAVLEPADQAIERLEREVGEWKDRALRAAADHDNFRKRMLREREESWARAQADVLARILEAVDDMVRVAQLDPEQTSAAALHEGVALVEKKLLKALEAAGLERIDPAGQPFDPQSHEAVTSVPAPEREADHTVGEVFQHGYRFRGALLRPARVAVLQWKEPEAPPEAAS